MASFADVERVEPDLADRVRSILSSTTNGVLGTIRRDGSPRLSGADPYFYDGQLRIWSMPRARKGQDLRRDPRVAVHSIPWDSRKVRHGAADVGEADAKVSGDSRAGFRRWCAVRVPRVVEVRAWRRAAGGLGPVHDRHRRARGHLGRQRSAPGRPVVDDRGPPDGATTVSPATEAGHLWFAASENDARTASCHRPQPPGRRRCPAPARTPEWKE